MKQHSASHALDNLEEFFDEENEPVFPWVRYWTPADQPIQLDANTWSGDSDGYLADPEDGFLGKYQNQHLVTTKALLESSPGCRILWGDPAIGKTRAIQREIEATPPPPMPCSWSFAI